jgi:hypothetical protein
MRCSDSALGCYGGGLVGDVESKNGCWQFWSCQLYFVCRRLAAFLGDVIHRFCGHVCGTTLVRNNGYVTGVLGFAVVALHVRGCTLVRFL